LFKCEIGKHQHQIPYVDRERYAVGCPDGRLAAAHRVTILQIIVDKCCVVQQLARGGPWYTLVGIRAEGLDGREGEARAQPLASGGKMLTRRLTRHSAWLKERGHQRLNLL
jgi:hypothetical protein